MKTVKLLNGGVIGNLKVGECARITDQVNQYVTSPVSGLELTPDRTVITTAHTRYILIRATGPKTCLFEKGCIFGSLEVGKSAHIGDGVKEYKTSIVQAFEMEPGRVTITPAHSRYVVTNPTWF